MLEWESAVQTILWPSCVQRGGRVDARADNVDARKKTHILNWQRFLKTNVPFTLLSGLVALSGGKMYI